MALKVPKALKDRMRKLSERVDWPSEIRKFVDERAREAEAQEHMRGVIELIKKTGQVRRGISTELVREDRDSR